MHTVELTQSLAYGQNHIHFAVHEQDCAWISYLQKCKATLKTSTSSRINVAYH